MLLGKTATTRDTSKQEMASMEHEGIIKISPQVSTYYTQISCNDEFVALPATANEVGIWRLEEADKKPVYLRRHSSQLTAVCFGHQKNPTYLCTASEDSIYIWQMEQAVIDYKTGKPSNALQIARDLGPCNHLCFSPDDLFLSACIEKEVWIINIETCELVATMTGHSANVTASIFCPHQISTLVTISEDRTFKIWDIANVVLLYQSNVISSSPFWSIAMHPENMHFSVGSGDGKIRVFDLISHRCIHEVEVTSSVAKMDISRDNSSLSSNSDVTITSFASWKQKQALYENSSDDQELEQSYSVICMAYWKENLAEDEAKESKSDPLISYDDTVREVLRDPPFLVAGCTSLVVFFDANTMIAVYRLDLMEPMMCFKRLDPMEYCISSVGCFAFSRSEDTRKIHCLAGSLLENNVHILKFQPNRTKHRDSDSSDTSYSNSEEDFNVSCAKTALPTQLSVLSSVPVEKGSPLLAALEPKKADYKGKGGKVSETGNKLNKPLTFKSKVKSSGYSEAPRHNMFQPRTNVPFNKVAAAKKSGLLKEKSGLGCSKFSLDTYPTKSEPPVQFKAKFNLPPKPTAIKSMKFSSDGKQMSCALGDTNAFMLKIPFNGKVSSYVGHDNVVNTADISHTNTLLLTASDDKTAKLWIPNQSLPLLNISRVKHNFNAEKVTPSSEQDNPAFPKEVTKASFYYVDKFILLSCLNTLYMYKYNIGETKSNIKSYQTLNRYKLVKEYEVEDAQYITTFSNINGFYSYIVLAACSDKSVAVYDMNIGKVVRRMRNVHERSVHSICQNQGSPFVTHPSEAYDLFLTSAATDGIKLWDLRADRCVRKFDGHMNRSHAVGVTYSPCSRFIATGSEDRSAYVFDIRNSAYLHRLSGHSDVVSCVNFHPERPMLATGSLDGKMHFYEDV